VSRKKCYRISLKKATVSLQKNQKRLDDNIRPVTPDSIPGMSAKWLSLSKSFLEI
jgi:hypothetical protein